MPRRALSLFLALLFLKAADAGQGPETTLVVVNAASPVSRAVALRYTELRDLPQSHLFFLKGVPSSERISLDEFRSSILDPVLAYLKQAGLSDDVDCIAYSADFPTAIDLRAATKGLTPVQGFTPVGSLNGMTYLYERVEEKDAGYAESMDMNGYFRHEVGGSTSQPRPPTSEERQAYMEAFQALRGKDYAKAAAAYSRFFKTYKTDATGWYNYACCLSRLGKVDAALDALRNAVRYGWHGAAHTQEDPDLAALRGKPGFQDVLRSMSAVTMQSSRGFSHEEAWTGADDPVPVSKGDVFHRYYLSVLLGYTGRYGNSLPEVDSYLASAAESDGTCPEGTVYILKNKNVRSTAREPFFGGTVAALHALHHKAEIDEGILPQKKNDVIGAVVGSAGFSWKKCGSTMLPGAICEHLTSFGGDFATASQTKLCEFLRYGAAGSSGTVVEPYAIWTKFPHPFLHVHYAEGCSLAEAFYESVAWPYQLLIVGDPLARPFAHFEKVGIDAPAGPWKGTVSLGLTGVSAPRAKAGTCELWVDGRRLGKTPAAAKPSLDTTKLDDGFHDVRLVYVDDGPIATRSFASLEAQVANSAHSLRLETIPKKVDFGAPLRVAGRAPGASKVEISLGSSCVDTSAVSAGFFHASLDSSQLGPGRAVLVVRAVYPGGPAVRSRELPVLVAPAPPEKAARKEGGTLPGLAGLSGKVPFVCNGEILPKSVAKAPQVTLSGEFHVAQPGFYELAADCGGDAELKSAGHVAKGAGRVYLPLYLESGWHPLELTYAPGGRARFGLLLEGAAVGAVPEVRHPAGAPLREATRVEKAEAALCDGKRTGAAVDLPEKGVVLFWRRTQKVGRLVLFPAKGKALPAGWVVEREIGFSWRPVAGLKTLVVPVPEAGKKKADKTAYVELQFDPVRTRKLRLRAKGKAALCEVEAYG